SWSTCFPDCRTFRRLMERDPGAWGYFAEGLTLHDSHADARTRVCLDCDPGDGTWDRGKYGRVFGGRSCADSSFTVLGCRSHRAALAERSRWIQRSVTRQFPGLANQKRLV